MIRRRPFRAVSIYETRGKVPLAKVILVSRRCILRVGLSNRDVVERRAFSEEVAYRYQSTSSCPRLAGKRGLDHLKLN